MSHWKFHHVDMETNKNGGPHQYNSLVKDDTRLTLFQMLFEQMLLSNQKDKVDIVSSVKKNRNGRLLLNKMNQHNYFECILENI